MDFAGWILKKDFLEDEDSVFYVFLFVIAVSKTNLSIIIQFIKDKRLFISLNRCSQLLINKVNMAQSPPSISIFFIYLQTYLQALICLFIAFILILNQSDVIMRFVKLVIFSQNKLEYLNCSFKILALDKENFSKAVISFFILRFKF